MAENLSVGAGAVDGVLEHREGRQELGVLAQDLQLRHLRLIVLVGVPGGVTYMTSASSAQSEKGCVNCAQDVGNEIEGT